MRVKNITGCLLGRFVLVLALTNIFFVFNAFSSVEENYLQDSSGYGGIVVGQ